MDPNIIKIFPEETLKEIYTDLAQPTVKEVGKFAARLPAVINAALATCDQWISQKQYNLEETKKLLELKLENINPEKIVSPEPYVAVPALQSLSYSMDNENLRDMYANLLANAMNSDTKTSVHPSYVEIIKQLSPFDALLLSKIKRYNDVDIPIVTLNLNAEESIDDNIVIEEEIQPHILPTDFYNSDCNLKNIAISIENLIRLNLINVAYDRHLSNINDYLNVKDNPKMLSLLRIHNFNKHLEIIKGVLHINSFGNAFLDICL